LLGESKGWSIRGLKFSVREGFARLSKEEGPNQGRRRMPKRSTYISGEKKKKEEHHPVVHNQGRSSTVGVGSTSRGVVVKGGKTHLVPILRRGGKKHKRVTFLVGRQP